MGPKRALLADRFPAKRRETTRRLRCRPIQTALRDKRDYHEEALKFLGRVSRSVQETSTLCGRRRRGRLLLTSREPSPFPPRVSKGRNP